MSQNSQEIREALQRVMERLRLLSPDEFQAKLAEHRDGAISYAFSGAARAADDSCYEDSKCILPEWHEGPCTCDASDPRVAEHQREVQ